MKKSPFSGAVCLPFCLALSIFVAVESAKADPTGARISIRSVNGNAEGCTNGTTFYPLQAGDFAGPGLILKTGAGATVDLILRDSGTVLRMLPETTLEFTKLNKQAAGEQLVSDTSLRLIKGTVIGSQRKLAVPSHFDIAMAQSVATIVGTEYVVSASGAVSVLDGVVAINYNLSGSGGSVQVSIPAGSTFDPATGTVVPTDPKYLQSIIADVKTVQQNAQTFKVGKASIVVTPEQFVSPTKGNNGVGNGVDPQPPGNPPINDGSGTSPGNPGNKGGTPK
jgi:hypothetical protein